MDETKVQIANGLKQLVNQGRPFEKLSIRDITSLANVRRSTFYYYFQDKYDALAWIFHDEVIDPTYPLLSAGMFDEALRLLLLNIKSEGKLYRSLIDLEGQNNLRDIIDKELYVWVNTFVQEYILHHGGRQAPSMDLVFTIDFYAGSSTAAVQNWIRSDYRQPIDQFVSFYRYLCNHTLEEALRGEE
ncbi:MAG: TetR/AcrR family transcriptional regulator C-terminal domain-containing protein [Eubacteriales bacterium]|nr:TetR/AcrR family transcriptional regulator C-terminal domain-containing protein [Eubacteriales bacterium]